MSERAYSAVTQIFINDIIRFIDEISCSLITYNKKNIW